MSSCVCQFDGDFLLLLFESPSICFSFALSVNRMIDFSMMSNLFVYFFFFFGCSVKQFETIVAHFTDNGSKLYVETFKFVSIRFLGVRLRCMQIGGGARMKVYS